jgi:hypothetical protein
MESNLQITIKGLTGELATNAGNAVGVVIRTFLNENTGLDLRRLSRIILTTDFTEALTELSQQKAIENPIGHTNEEYAVAVGKVLVFPLDQDYEIVLVFNAHVIANGLLVENRVENQNKDLFNSALHFLHHELYHIHDYNKILDSLPMPKYIGKDQFIFPLAWACWGEYFANLMSSSSASESQVRTIVESFRDAIKQSQSKVNEEIRAYRIHGDIDRLMSVFSRHGEFLPKMAAYTLGYMDGLGKSLADLSPDTAEILSGSYFESTWNDMHMSLKKMLQERSHGWNDLDIYNDLATAIDNYYARMGLELSTTGEGETYIRVPFRTETTSST